MQKQASHPNKIKHGSPVKEKGGWMIGMEKGAISQIKTDIPKGVEYKRESNLVRTE